MGSMARENRGGLVARGIVKIFCQSPRALRKSFERKSSRAPRRSMVARTRFTPHRLCLSKAEEVSRSFSPPAAAPNRRRRRTSRQSFEGHRQRRNCQRSDARQNSRRPSRACRGRCKSKSAVACGSARLNPNITCRPVFQQIRRVRLKRARNKGVAFGAKRTSTGE
jgi:hypothetical protein